VRILASPEAVRFIQDRGGQVFVWAVPFEVPTLGGRVFTLQASTDSPGPTLEFRRLVGEGFQILIDPGARELPDELHFAVRGWRTKRICAYWNGHSLGRD
jgi:hypothetical protein